MKREPMLIRTDLPGDYREETQGFGMLRMKREPMLIRTDLPGDYREETQWEKTLRCDPVLRRRIFWARIKYWLFWKWYLLAKGFRS